MRVAQIKVRVEVGWEEFTFQEVEVVEFRGGGHVSGYVTSGRVQPY
jgi:hypothetical protein